MKNLVRLAIFDKVFYTTPGTEISIENQTVYFFPSNDGYVFVDCVKFYGMFSFDNNEKEMNGSIKTTCRNTHTNETLNCDNLITLKEGRFTLSGLDQDSNRITITCEPVADTSIVEMFIEETPELNAQLAEFLRANPSYFDMTFKDKNIQPADWTTASMLIQESKDAEELNDTIQIALGAFIGEAFIKFMNSKK